MSKQPPPAPTVSAVGLCPTVIQIPVTGSLPSTIAPPDHPQNRSAALGRPAMKLLGDSTSLRSTNPRP